MNLSKQIITTDIVKDYINKLVSNYLGKEFIRNFQFTFLPVKKLKYHDDNLHYYTLLLFPKTKTANKLDTYVKKFAETIDNYKDRLLLLDMQLELIDYGIKVKTGTKNIGVIKFEIKTY